MLDVVSHPVVEVYPCLHTTNTLLEIYQLTLRRACLTTLSPIQRCTKSWSKSYQPGPANIIARSAGRLMETLNLPAPQRLTLNNVRCAHDLINLRSRRHEIGDKNALIQPVGSSAMFARETTR